MTTGAKLFLAGARNATGFMGQDIGLLLVSLLTLFVGAEGLVRGSVSLAIRLGVGPLIVGLTVVAFGTSSPELVVSASASVNGQSGIAVGNAVGSNIFNIGVVLGLSSLIWPIKIHFSVIRWDAPIMVIVTAIGVVLCMMGEISRTSGFLLLLGLRRKVSSFYIESWDSILKWTGGKYIPVSRDELREIQKAAWPERQQKIYE